MNSDNLICVKYLFRLAAVANFRDSFTHAQHVLGYHDLTWFFNPGHWSLIGILSHSHPHLVRVIVLAAIPENNGSYIFAVKNINKI